ncbi:MAG: outer membrane lipoprotein-sorting protein [Polyangia bacterium]
MLKRTLSALVCAGLIGSAGLALAQPAPANPTTPAAPAAPAAGESAEQLLKRIDAAAAAFKDAFFHFKMRIKDPGQVREVEFTTMQKGQKRLVRFLAPGDIKGMGFLSESADVMYALLPAFGNRVRRLGTSQMNQNFMGSDLLSSDMNAADLSALFTAKSAGTDGELTVLELTPKAAGLQKQKLYVDGKTALVHKVEYLDDSGKKVRTAVRSDFQKDPSGFLTPGKMVYTDHRRNNHETELVLVKATFNNGYTDDNFSQRALTRN